MISSDPCLLQQLCPNDTILINACKGRTIYAPGQSADYVYHLHKGIAAIITSSAEGAERTVMLIVPSQFMGFTALTNMQCDRKRIFLAEARAITPVTYCKIRREAFWDVLDDRNLRSIFINSIGSLVLDMALLTTSPLKDAITRRIYYILKILSRGIGHKCENGVVAIKGLSHEDIAMIANTSRSTVTRVLKDMERVGIITVHNRQIAVNINFAPFNTGRFEAEKASMSACYSG